MYKSNPFNDYLRVPTYIINNHTKFHLDELTNFVNYIKLNPSLDQTLLLSSYWIGDCGDDEDDEFDDDYMSKNVKELIYQAISTNNIIIITYLLENNTKMIQKYQLKIAISLNRPQIAAVIWQYHPNLISIDKLIKKCFLSEHLDIIKWVLTLPQVEDNINCIVTDKLDDEGNVKELVPLKYALKNTLPVSIHCLLCHYNIDPNTITTKIGSGMILDSSNSQIEDQGCDLDRSNNNNNTNDSNYNNKKDDDNNNTNDNNNNDSNYNNNNDDDFSKHVPDQGTCETTINSDTTNPSTNTLTTHNDDIATRSNGMQVVCDNSNTTTRTRIPLDITPLTEFYDELNELTYIEREPYHQEWIIKIIDSNNVDIIKFCFDFLQIRFSLAPFIEPAYGTRKEYAWKLALIRCKVISFEYLVGLTERIDGLERQEQSEQIKIEKELVKKNLEKEIPPIIQNQSSTSNPQFLGQLNQTSPNVIESVNSDNNNTVDTNGPDGDYVASRTDNPANIMVDGGIINPTTVIIDGEAEPSEITVSINNSHPIPNTHQNTIKSLSITTLPLDTTTNNTNPTVTDYNTNTDSIISPKNKPQLIHSPSSSNSKPYTLPLFQKNTKCTCPGNVIFNGIHYCEEDDVLTALMHNDSLWSNDQLIHILSFLSQYKSITSLIDRSRSQNGYTMLQLALLHWDIELVKYLTTSLSSDIIFNIGLGTYRRRIHAHGTTHLIGKKHYITPSFNFNYIMCNDKVIISELSHSKDIIMYLCNINEFDGWINMYDTHGVSRHKYEDESSSEDDGDDDDEENGYGNVEVQNGPRWVTPLLLLASRQQWGGGLIEMNKEYDYQYNNNNIVINVEQVDVGDNELLCKNNNSTTTNNNTNNHDNSNSCKNNNDDNDNNNDTNINIDSNCTTIVTNANVNINTNIPLLGCNRVDINNVINKTNVYNTALYTMLQYGKPNINNKVLPHYQSLLLLNSKFDIPCGYNIIMAAIHNDLVYNIITICEWFIDGIIDKNPCVTHVKIIDTWDNNMIKQFSNENNITIISDDNNKNKNNNNNHLNTPQRQFHSSKNTPSIRQSQQLYRPSINIDEYINNSNDEQDEEQKALLYSLLTPRTASIVEGLDDETTNNLDIVVIGRDSFSYKDNNDNNNNNKNNYFDTHVNTNNTVLTTPFIAPTIITPITAIMKVKNEARMVRKATIARNSILAEIGKINGDFTQLHKKMKSQKRKSKGVGVSGGLKKGGRYSYRTSRNSYNSDIDYSDSDDDDDNNGDDDDDEEEFKRVIIQNSNNNIQLNMNVLLGMIGMMFFAIFAMALSKLLR